MGLWAHKKLNATLTLEAIAPLVITVYLFFLKVMAGLLSLMELAMPYCRKNRGCSSYFTRTRSLRMLTAKGNNDRCP
jgi:hypothetical protein